MKQLTRSKAEKDSSNWAPFIVSGIALMLAIATTLYVARTTETKARERFDIAAQQINDTIQDLVSRHITLLHGIRGLAYATPTVTRKQFEAYVKSLDLEHRYSGVQGLGFSLRLTPEKKSELLEFMRTQGYSNFHLHPDSERSEYHAIVYLEPLNRRNQAAIGYDMFTEPVRRAAMEKARDTAGLAVSGKVTLVQEIEGPTQAGFLIYLPIYKSGNVPATLEQRREELVGFIYSPFRADDLLNRILAARTAPALAMEIYDGPERTPDHLLHASSHRQQLAAKPGTAHFQRLEKIPIGDRTWNAVLTGDPEFFRDSTFQAAPWVLVTGIAFSILLFSVTRSQTMLYQAARGHAAELERRVALRTTELEAANSNFQNEITERKRAEQQIRDSQRELREYIDNMSTLNAKVALDGTLLLVNRTAEQGSGLSREQLLRTNFLEGKWWTFDPVVHQRVTTAFRRAVAGESINYEEQVFVFGRPLPINFSLVPVRDETGRVSYILAEGRDVSALKQAELALKHRTAELEIVVKELDAFSYSVSHDLRAPVRHITAFIEMILANPANTLDEPSRQSLATVSQSAKQLGRLIDDLLSFSRMARSEMTRTSVDAKRLVAAIVAGLRHESQSHNVEWKIGPLPKVTGDSAMLERVFVNLLSNALKYSRTRDPAVIEVGARSGDDSEMVFFVRDNGVGFDMKFTAKLFQVFQRLHRAEDFEGTGIGLANVQRIIHRHGGRVWAEGAIGQGATFYFSLPNQSYVHNELEKNSAG